MAIEENDDHYLRITALKKAIALGYDEDDDVDDIVEAAEAFFKFLKGGEEEGEE